MTRSLILSMGVAALSGIAGLALLVRPKAAGAVLRLPEGEPARYALRIAGAMLAAFALFIGGFAITLETAA